MVAVTTSVLGTIFLVRNPDPKLPLIGSGSAADRVWIPDKVYVTPVKAANALNRKFDFSNA